MVVTRERDEGAIDGFCLSCGQQVSGFYIAVTEPPARPGKYSILILAPPVRHGQQEPLTSALLRFKMESSSPVPSC